MTLAQEIARLLLFALTTALAPPVQAAPPAALAAQGSGFEQMLILLSPLAVFVR